MPKDKLGEIIPFLEDVLQYDAKSGWKRLMEKLNDYFDGHFEPDWKKAIVKLTKDSKTIEFFEGMS